MLTLHGLRNAHALADDLRRIREAAKAVREDNVERCDLRVHGLRRTYGLVGGDTHQVAAPVQKSRVLKLLAEEEAEIVGILRDLGVDASAPTEAPDGR